LLLDQLQELQLLYLQHMFLRLPILLLLLLALLWEHLQLLPIDHAQKMILKIS